MKKMHAVIMALIVAVLFVSGCTNGGEKTTPLVDTNEVSQNPTPPADDDTLSKEVTNDISSVDNTSTELTDTDVDNLDKDLANVNW